MKELEDYSWFPAALRRWQMEFIGNVVIWVKLYKPFVPVIQQLAAENKITALQDLCSGSGMPAVYIANRLTRKLPLQLTDKYPDTRFKNIPGVSYSLLPVDCTAIEPEKNICYTMFNAFHHFPATQQEDFINRMAKSKTPFIIAEILEPGLVNMIKIIFTTTILQLFAAPFVKPFSLLRLFFTYIIPVNIITVTYDGIISVLKSKTVVQYRSQLNSLSTTDFTITIAAIHNFKGNIVYIKGAPINT